ncbi:MAG: DUF4129 domain-containing protein [Candidatus Hydrogenedentes bacterium]|nr:DUF4129 domain-containing protein [Candidatus Hydrogenedentota bacterium]
MKSAYALRCFHGESLSTGEDLRVALRRAIVSRGLHVLAIATAAFATCMAAGRVHAQDAPAAPAVQAGDLDRAIAAELEKAEYVWRMPKEVPADAFEENFLTRFLRAVLDSIGKLLESFFDLLRWINNHLPSAPDSMFDGGAAGSGWVSTQRALWLLVFGTLLAALAVIVYRIYRQRKTAALEIAATPALVVPNIEDEDVSADALPEDGWLDLARGLADRGDLRLAMRALFLASLAALARRELVRIAKAKSNREYLRELERVAHAVPDAPPLFATGVRAFERVWYGNHDTDRFAFREFESGQERIRALARQH